METYILVYDGEICTAELNKSNIALLDFLREHGFLHDEFDYEPLSAIDSFDYTGEI